MTRDLRDRRAVDGADDLVDVVAQLAFTVTAALSPVAASAGLSLTQLRVLGILRDHEPRMAQLAERLGLDRSTVSCLVDRAAARGLVERIPDPDDGRASRVRLTTPGHTLASEVTGRATHALAPLLSGVRARERADLAGRLRRLLPEDLG